MTTLLITGGIGSGKSLVCRLLADRGVPVYDFDGRTKALYDEDPALLSDIVATMRPYLPSGKSLLRPDGRIDRSVLSETVFSDTGALSELENKVHPAVLRDFERWRGSRTERVLAAESAIALWKPLFRGIFDGVVLVDAPVELRKRRASLRDGVTEETVERRMRSQSLFNGISEGSALTADVDYVIQNDKDEAALAAETDKVLLEIINRYENRSQ